MKKTEIKLYILEAIDLDEYIGANIVPGVGTIRDLLYFTCYLFVSDKTEARIKENKKQTFIDWFCGMPSYFNIEIDNYKQDILLQQWGAEDKEFNDVIYDTFMEMLNEYGITQIE